MKVADLIDSSTMSRKYDVIFSIFGEEIHEEIVRLPLSLRNPADMHSWSGKKHGNFTVRSAYHLAYSSYAHGI